LDFGRDPAVFDGTTPFRISDHDPIVLNFQQLEKGMTLAPTTDGNAGLGKKNKGSMGKKTGLSRKDRRGKKDGLSKDGKDQWR
jgi:hypothetical protein